MPFRILFIHILNIVFNNLEIFPRSIKINLKNSHPNVESLMKKFEKQALI